MLMEIVTLKRIAGNDDGTYGVIIENNIPYEVTLEETWKNNTPFESCIPTGVYICEKFYSMKFSVDTYKIKDVSNRSDCIFHPGNTEIDTEGCILIGTRFGHLIAKDDDSGRIEYQPGILSSKLAFDRFIKRRNQTNKFILYVISS